MLYPVKIEFKDYPSGSWQDWSQFLNEPPAISKKVESDNEGEAGIIVVDSADVVFRNEPSSVVYNAYSIDLSSKQRYLYRISAIKSDKTYRQLYEGMADFSTLRRPEYGKLVSISLMDKLSAMNILQSVATRIWNTFQARALALNPNTVSLRFDASTDPNYPNITTFYVTLRDINGDIITNFPSPIINPGEIILFNVNNNLQYGFVSESYVDNNPGHYWNVVNLILPVTFESGYYPIQLNENWIQYGSKEIYGIDVLVYDAGTPIAINTKALFEVFIKTVWSDITVTFNDVPDTNLPLDYFSMILSDSLFNKEPLDALKMLADTMRSYVYIDKTGNCIVQYKASLDSAGTLRTIGTTKIVSGPEEAYFWDKLVDGVEVNVKSWTKDTETGEYIEASASITKQPVGFTSTAMIQPKNPITKEILIADPDFIATQENLDAYAAQEALNIINFYGLRHSAFDLILKLDDNTIEWELTDRLLLGGLSTFFVSVDFDLVERELVLKPVEIAGHEYDYRQIVVGSSNETSSTSSFSSGGGITIIGGTTYAYNIPLVVSGGIVSLAYTSNFKITSNQLDTIQDIKTTDTPTFNQLSLSSSGSSSLNAVRADRSIQILTTAPLTGGGAAVNLTSNRSWTLGLTQSSLLGTSNQVNVVNGNKVLVGNLDVTLSLPQDIHSTATPTFNQVTLNNAGSGVSSAVRADRLINTSSPLSGGGNLTADRTISLNYNATNLKLGLANELNTIQDIAITSSPTFVNLNLTGVVLSTGTGNNTFAGNTIYSGNKALYYTSFASGWAGAGWRLDYGISAAAQSTLELDNLWVRGTMNVYELVINTIRATNGSLFVTSSAKVESTSGGTAGDIRIYFEDPENHGVCPFASGDFLLSQVIDLDGTTVVRRTVVYVESVTGNSIDATFIVGSIVEIGDAFARIANDGAYPNRQGSIYLTSDDSNSPFIDIKDGVASWTDWSDATKIKVRLGKLTGITDSFFGALSGYGLYTNSAFLKGKIYAQAGGWIAGWDINATSLSSPVVSDGTYDYQMILTADDPNNRIGLYLHSDITAVSSPSFLSFGKIKDGSGSYQTNYGIAFKSGSLNYFELSNTTKQIAGWTFSNITFTSPSGKLLMRSDTNTIYSAPLTGLVKYVMFGQTYSGTAYTGKYGISAIDNSNNYLFRLDDGACEIAGWTFDYLKFTKGTATTGISLNTSATAFITGATAKGFEVYDPSNPKLFIGKKDGNFLDWNISAANALTIQGILKTGITGTRVVIGEDVNSSGTANIRFYDASENKVMLIGSGSNGVAVSGGTEFRVNPIDIETSALLVTKDSLTVNMRYDSFPSHYKTTSITKDGVSIDGYLAMRWRGVLSSAPTTDLRNGDTYLLSLTSKIYMYANSAWIILN